MVLGIEFRALVLHLVLYRLLHTTGGTIFGYLHGVSITVIW